jgi:hypothetical protein
MEVFKHYKNPCADIFKKKSKDLNLPEGVALEPMKFALTEEVVLVWGVYFSLEVQSLAMQVLSYAVAMDNHVAGVLEEEEAVPNDALAFLHFDSKQKKLV